MPLGFRAIIWTDNHLTVPAEVVSVLFIVVYALKLQCLDCSSFGCVPASFHLQLKIISWSRSHLIIWAGIFKTTHLCPYLDREHIGLDRSWHLVLLPWYTQIKALLTLPELVWCNLTSEIRVLTELVLPFFRTRQAHNVPYVPDFHLLSNEKPLSGLPTR